MDEKENINMEKPRKENKVLSFFITTLNGMAY